MKHSLPLRALSRLLQYPDLELIEHLPEVATALYEMPKLSKKVHLGLMEFVNNLEASDLMGSQENYVECFDRGRATSLHLFEHKNTLEPKSIHITNRIQYIVIAY